MSRLRLTEPLLGTEVQKSFAHSVSASGHGLARERWS